MIRIAQVGQILFDMSYTSVFVLGSIDLKEMTKIMGCLLELEGIGKVTIKSASKFFLV